MSHESSKGDIASYTPSICQLSICQLSICQMSIFVCRLLIVDFSIVAHYFVSNSQCHVSVFRGKETVDEGASGSSMDAQWTLPSAQCRGENGVRL